MQHPTQFVLVFLLSLLLTTSSAYAARTCTRTVSEMGGTVTTRVECEIDRSKNPDIIRNLDRLNDKVEAFMDRARAKLDILQARIASLASRQPSANDRMSRVQDKLDASRDRAAAQRDKIEAQMEKLRR